MLDVLVADDDVNVLESVSRALIDAGHQVTEACDGAEAAELLATHAFDLAVCDVQMPKVGGLTLLRRIRREAPETAVVLMTAYGQIPDVIESLRDGAVDYVTKPFDPDDFAARVVGPIAERRAIKRKFDHARAQAVARVTGEALVATSPAMRKLAGRLGVLAGSDVPLVVVGDRGTGKELVARTLHAQGPRRGGPFVLMDGVVLADLLAPGPDGCAPASREWLAGAVGGTLVLDGLDPLTLAAQVHLARLLESPSAVARKGGDGRPLGARIVTLTRTSMADRLVAGKMLDSLYHRLNGVQIHVPRLAERQPDLVGLATLFLREIVPAGTTAPGIAAETWRVLAGHGYAGNVRELRWILEHAVAMADGGPILPEHLPQEVGGAP
jgi:DNA-binding NtrC family response regulator